MRDVLHINEKEGYMLITGNGMNQYKGEVPYHIHYYRLNLKSGELIGLTPEQANHSGFFSSDYRYLVDVYSRPDLPPVSVVRSVIDGKMVMELQKADISRLMADKARSAHYCSITFFYKVAVALCGCHDNRMDKIWWNEQWMGYPVGPWYAENSNVDNAHRLEGKLLLKNGELDDNVDPASTLQVVNALVKADKDFEQFYLPGYGHSLGDNYVTRKVFEFFCQKHEKVFFYHGRDAVDTLIIRLNQP